MSQDQFHRGPVTVTVHDDGALEIYAPEPARAISRQWAVELCEFLSDHYYPKQYIVADGELNEADLQAAIARTPAPKRRGRPPKAQP